MSTIDIRGMCPLLQVFDMAASVGFYTEVLGFEVVETSDPGDHFDWAWLRREGADLMLNTMYESERRPPVPDPSRVAAHKDTALFFNCPDIDDVYRHLRSRDLQVEPPVTRDYGMRQVYLTDPDGYMLCFQWPVDHPTPEE